MKKRFIFASVVAALMGMATACQPSAETNGAPAGDLSMLCVDSVTVDTTWALSDPDLRDMVEEGVQPGLKCVVDVPRAEQAPVLANAVMEWINEWCLDGCCGDDLKDIRSMIAEYVTYVCKQEADAGMGADAQYEFQIRKVYENANVVTFLFTSYDYAFGAAHGDGYTRGATFRKSDGKRFGWNMFRLSANLQPQLKKGLMAYFEVKTDKELEENLMVDNLYSADYLPKPQTDPWVTEEGVVMLYQSYEAACYAAGHPTLVIARDELEPLLTATAYKLIR